MTGLPDSITACLFDLDGVLTGTAKLHRKAWTATFDDFLEQRDGPDFRRFTEDDYLDYVDGKPRADGVRDFLASRDIDLPEGTPDDPPSAESVHGIGNRKNDMLLAAMEREGVEPYAGSVKYVRAAEQAGLAIGVVTSSANGAAVLEAADLKRYVKALVDGRVIAERGLAGKPAPDSFLAGAEALDVEPSHAAVFEDAVSGVSAGRAGGFGIVIGVDRADQAEKLRENGADVVVADLAELLED
jgi:beta-phosphoglucomutase family hydrolase